jgi:hypothetical protein
MRKKCLKKSKKNECFEKPNACSCVLKNVMRALHITKCPPFAYAKLRLVTCHPNTLGKFDKILYTYNRESRSECSKWEEAIIIFSNNFGQNIKYEIFTVDFFWKLGTNGVPIICQR